MIVVNEWWWNSKSFFNFAETWYADTLCRVNIFVFPGCRRTTFLWVNERRLAREGRLALPRSLTSSWWMNDDEKSKEFLQFRWNLVRRYFISSYYICISTMPPNKSCYGLTRGDLPPRGDLPCRVARDFLHFIMINDEWWWWWIEKFLWFRWNLVHRYILPS